ncbi:dual oxidase maturation factor 1 [Folsomia candida]|uniref:dual oxidase maturation factor 1 n=1 Tax=Folsomia candida TaxID=158441 RepID=UPI000B8FEF19|nr:dual oxidase maturation factor 1 [Folsomia candida]
MTRSFSFFDFGRSEKLPTQYSEQHSAAPIDVFTTSLILGWVIIAICFFAILPAYGKHKRRSLLVRIVASLFIGGVVLVGNYGHNWEIATAQIITPYKPYTHEEIKGEVGLHITLRGINITLTGAPLKHNVSDKSSLDYERIDYNENFSWEWAQGRFGFGYYAGQISKDFRAATERGVPLPILQIAEYFTFDGEGIRFGRYYRLAGWYAHILIWTAFGTWVISNILFSMIISSAVYFLIVTGLLQLSAIGVWTFLRNPTEIQIPFQSGDNPEDDLLLRTRFGPDYYLVLGNGIFCVLLGFLVMILNVLMPDEMCTFFGIDPLTIYDELLLSNDELETVQKEKDKDKASLIELGHVSTNPDVFHGGDYDTSRSSSGGQSSKKVSFHEEGGERPGSTSSEGKLVLKRRENVGSTLFRRSFKVKPKPKPRKYGAEQPSSSQQPLLSPPETRHGSSDDEESHFSWPIPPRSSFLRRPPSPPPKRRLH